MQRARSILFGLALVTSAACGAASGRSGPTAHALADAADARAFASASNELGLDVWERLRATHGSENLAISPVSIATALAMTYGGASGDTALAMATTMHLSSPPDATMAAAGDLVRGWNDPSRIAYELSVANRLFAERHYAFRDTYVAATRDQMGAELERLDFAGSPGPARLAINDWVSDRTHERIQDLLPDGSITPDTRLVLVNAVYFHGQWQTTFDTSLTRERPFHAPSGERPAQTMYREGAAYGEDDDVQLLELPYTGGDLRMLFVLPRSREGLPEVESRLDDALVARWAARTHDDERVQVYLPRFRIETDSISLRDALSELGMAVAFSDAADFRAMSEPAETPLEIDDVFHRVFVELNEEGTEAAAATAVTMVLETASIRQPPPPPRFEADHPFLFFLREPSTGAILFAGRVVDP